MIKKKEDIELEEALKYDPLAEAEKMFGRDTDLSKSFGLFAHIESNKRKSEMLEKRGDTKFSNTIESYLSIISDFGFEEIYKETLPKREDDSHPHRDIFYSFWHFELGILLCFDTFMGKVNGGTFHYNWFIPYSMNHHQFCSNGNFQRHEGGNILTHYDENMNLLEVKEKTENYNCEKQNAFNKKLFDTTYGLWVGNTDAREALLHNIKKLRDNGKILKQWIDISPTFSITCGRDYSLENENHLDVSLRRLEKFPDDVKKKICYDKIVKNHKEWKNRKT